MATDTSKPGTEQSTAGADQPAENYAPEQLDNEGAGTTGNAKSADVNLDLVLEVPVSVSLQVGSTELAIRDLVQLVEGSVVALDREANEAMDVLVNGKLVAHGEIVVVDEQFGVRLTDVVSPTERIEKIA